MQGSGQNRPDRNQYETICYEHCEHAAYGDAAVASTILNLWSAASLVGMEAGRGGTGVSVAPPPMEKQSTRRHVKQQVGCCL